MIASHSDTHEVLVYIVGSEITHNLGVGNLFLVIGKEIYVTYYMEGVGDFDMLC